MAEQRWQPWYDDIVGLSSDAQLHIAYVANGGNAYDAHLYCEFLGRKRAKFRDTEPPADSFGAVWVLIRLDTA